MLCVVSEAIDFVLACSTSPAAAWSACCDSHVRRHVGVFNCPVMLFCATLTLMPRKLPACDACMCRYRLCRIWAVGARIIVGIRAVRWRESGDWGSLRVSDGLAALPCVRYELWFFSLVDGSKQPCVKQLRVFRVNGRWRLRVWPLGDLRVKRWIAAARLSAGRLAREVKTEAVCCFRRLYPWLFSSRMAVNSRESDSCVLCA